MSLSRLCVFGATPTCPAMPLHQLTLLCLCQQQQRSSSIKTTRITRSSCSSSKSVFIRPEGAIFWLIGLVNPDAPPTCVTSCWLSMARVHQRAPEASDWLDQVCCRLVFLIWFNLSKKHSLDAHARPSLHIFRNSPLSGERSWGGNDESVGNRRENRVWLNSWKKWLNIGRYNILCRNEKMKKKEIAENVRT